MQVTELFRDATSGIYNSISKIQTCIQVSGYYSSAIIDRFSNTFTGIGKVL